MPPRLAVLTMAYNESVFLPIWARHYARQAGADHCYVVDHGSTEPIVLPPGMNVIRLPRSPHDDLRRARFISQISSGLLEYYDWVIYTDVDELVLADPVHYSNLPEFCATLTDDTINAVGFDIQHIPLLESSLNLSDTIGQQRGWVRFTGAMCKPVLTRRPLAWAPGFHTSDQKPAFMGLYLFHLHWADLDIGLNRLARTRIMPWVDDVSGDHQRINDIAWTELFNGMANLPRTGSFPFNHLKPPISCWTAQVVSAQTRVHPLENPSFAISAAELWPIPAHFRARL